MRVLLCTLKRIAQRYVLHSRHRLKHSYNMAKRLALSDNEAMLQKLLLDVAEYAGSSDKYQKPTLRFAGGWVRDKLMGSTSNDIDVAIDNMTGEDFGLLMSNFLQQPNQTRYPSHTRLAKIEANPDKSKHLATATTKILGLQIDLVNLRKETYTEESRNPTVEFGTAEEDALRRDSTVNALFYNLNSLEVEDFTKRGLQDLELKVIKTPLPPLETFTDDPLRVLRAIRFASRLGFDIDEGDKQAMCDARIKQALKVKISRERVGTEVLTMLKGPRPSVALTLLDDLRLYNTVFASSQYGTVQTEGWSRAYRTLLSIMSVGRSESGKSSLQTLRRLLFRDENDVFQAWLVACFIPWAAVEIKPAPSSASRRPPSPASLAAREGMKAENRFFKLVDDAVTHRLHVVAQINTLATHVALLKPDVNRRSSPTDRVAYGQAIRRWGSQWRTIVVFGLLFQALEGNSDYDIDRHLDGYADWLKEVETLELLDIDKLKPITTGDEVAKIFPDASKGPWMKKALEMVMEWQLHNPGSTDRAKALDEHEFASDNGAGVGGYPGNGRSDVIPIE